MEKLADGIVKHSEDVEARKILDKINHGIKNIEKDGRIIDREVNPKYWAFSDSLPVEKFGLSIEENLAERLSNIKNINPDLFDEFISILKKTEVEGIRITEKIIDGSHHMAILQKTGVEVDFSKLTGFGRQTKFEGMMELFADGKLQKSLETAFADFNVKTKLKKIEFHNGEFYAMSNPKEGILSKEIVKTD